MREGEQERSQAGLSIRGLATPWAQPALGALATGALAAAAMWFLGAEGVTGGGYATVDAALAGKLGAGVLVPLCLASAPADVMRPPLAVQPDTDLRTAFELMRSSGLRELPITDPEGRVVGLVDEVSIARAHMGARARAS